MLKASSKVGQGLTKLHILGELTSALREIMQSSDFLLNKTIVSSVMCSAILLKQDVVEIRIFQLRSKKLLGVSLVLTVSLFTQKYPWGQNFNTFRYDLESPPVFDLGKASKAKLLKLWYNAVLKNISIV